MDIPALSMAMASNQVQADFSVAMLSKTLDTAQTSNADLVQMMERSVNPEIGGNIDIVL